MVAMIRPTLLLKMNLDESLYSEEAAAEIKRSYAYVSPTMVDHHVTGDHGVENIMEFLVKIRQPYWSSADQGADDLWNDVMLKWFGNMFEKISTTARSYNEKREEKNEPVLDFTWIDIVLGQESTVSILLNEDSSVPSDAPKILDLIRGMVNQGILGERPGNICVPSRSVLASAGGASEDKSDPKTDDADSSSEHGELDHSLWDVEDQHGQTRLFDSKTKTFIDRSRI